MVIRLSVVAVHDRSTRLVVLTAVFLGLAIGNWQIDGQLQAPVPSASQENKGLPHLKMMQESVQTLASELEEIYPAGCDAVSCDLDTCSQDECLPLTGSRSCSKVKFNARCAERCPSNSSIMVMAEKSSTGYPRAPGGSGSPDDAQTTSICGTVRLDSTFQALYEKNPYYAEYYVGFPDGSRRSFPGKEEADPTSLYPCTSYDSRLRPWYNAAISNRNHLVILVDSKAEALDPAYTEWPHTLALAKVLADKLLGTLYNNDRVNIVPFSSAAKATALLSESVEVSFDPLDPQTHAELRPLKQKLAAQENVGVSSSNLTAGLQEALRLFLAASDKNTKNVIVFTDGGISYDESTLDQLYDSSVRLFIYSTKNADGKLKALDDVAERVDGAHILLLPTGTLSTNPLYELRAYFRYLADMQFRSDRTMPVWTPVYRDYYDVGDMYTVIAPAFSKSEPRRFIGVAAIDVLYKELGDIWDDFQIALAQREFKDGSIDGYASIFRSISMSVYNDNVTKSCNIKGRGDALCQRSSKVDPNQNFLERVCCSECFGGSDRLKILPIVLSTTIPGFLFLVSLLIVLVWWWRRRYPVVTVVEDDSGVQDEKLESAASTGRTPSGGLGLGSLRTEKKVELAKSGGQRATTQNSRWTPIQIRHSAMRLGVDKFTLEEAKYSSSQEK